MASLLCWLSAALCSTVWRLHKAWMSHCRCQCRPLLHLLLLPGIYSWWRPVIMATVGLWQGRSGLDWSRLESSAGCSAEVLCLIRPILLSGCCLFPLWRSSVPISSPQPERNGEKHSLCTHLCTNPPLLLTAAVFPPQQSTTSYAARPDTFISRQSSSCAHTATFGGDVMAARSAEPVLLWSCAALPHDHSAAVSGCRLERKQ